MKFAKKIFMQTVQLLIVKLQDYNWLMNSKKMLKLTIAYTYGANFLEDLI